jgi:hypothetical protein
MLQCIALSSECRIAQSGTALWTRFVSVSAITAVKAATRFVTHAALVKALTAFAITTVSWTAATCGCRH